jgi:predicted nucleic-acid-binding protein
MSLSSVIDTSILVRYLAHDDAEKAAAEHALLSAADDSSLLMPDVALAELGFVLLRVYRWPPRKVADAIRAVVNHRAITVPGRDLWLDVAADLEAGRGLVDGYLLRTAERVNVRQVLTFDIGMKPLGAVRPVDPARG